MLAQALGTSALGLLGTSGVAKLIDPDPTTGAMSAARLPSSTLLSRLLGVLEVVLAVSGLAVGGRLPLAAATLLYLAFALFTFGARVKRLPLQSCGCFGRDDTPPTAIHVAYNVVAMLGLGYLSIAGLAPIEWNSPLIALGIYLVFAGIGVYASYLLLATLPRLHTHIRSA